MKFIKTILFLILFLKTSLSSAQYSNYYQVGVNSNSQVNINNNVNVTGNINKTITTIDYGALRIANALQEKNRLELLTYNNDLLKKQAIEIAQDPQKAFEYGLDNNWIVPSKIAKEQFGLKGFTWYHKIPHQSLFSPIGGDYKYRNESEEGIVTEIEIGSFIMSDVATEKFKKFSIEQKEIYLANLNKYAGNTEKYIKEVDIKDIKIQELHTDGELKGTFVHKIDLNKANVWGEEGFNWSIFYEDDYEYVIRDNYRVVLQDGTIVYSAVIYKGSKNKIDFEKLEGRREYFRRLANQIISTINIINIR